MGLSESFKKLRTTAAGAVLFVAPIILTGTADCNRKEKCYPNSRLVEGREDGSGPLRKACLHESHPNLEELRSFCAQQAAIVIAGNYILDWDTGMLHHSRENKGKDIWGCGTHPQ